MHRFSQLLLATIASLFLSQSAMANGAFTMSYRDEAEKPDITDVYWMDTITAASWDTRQETRAPYPGIIIYGRVEGARMMIFLPDYQGVGTYYLKGTSDRDYYKTSNAVFSTGNAAAYWVSPLSTHQSIVMIEKDANGVICGTYDVAVYHSGKVAYLGQARHPIRLQGAFEDVTQKDAQ